jgi:hypothetical protein
MGHSSKTADKNRKVARSIKDEKGKQLFKGTEPAREAGLDLPSADEKADQNAGISPRKGTARTPVQKPKNNG